VSKGTLVTLALKRPGRGTATSRKTFKATQKQESLRNGGTDGTGQAEEQGGCHRGGSKRVKMPMKQRAKNAASGGERKKKKKEKKNETTEAFVYGVKGRLITRFGKRQDCFE